MRRRRRRRRRRWWWGEEETRGERMFVKRSDVQTLVVVGCIHKKRNMNTQKICGLWCEVCKEEEEVEEEENSNPSNLLRLLWYLQQSEKKLVLCWGVKEGQTKEECSLLVLRISFPSALLSSFFLFITAAFTFIIDFRLHRRLRTSSIRYVYGMSHRSDEIASRESSGRKRIAGTLISLTHSLVGCDDGDARCVLCFGIKTRLMAPVWSSFHFVRREKEMRERRRRREKKDWKFLHWRWDDERKEENTNEKNNLRIVSKWREVER